MRILVVAPIPFDVEANPRVIRSERIVAGLVARGHEVVVLGFWDGAGRPPPPPAGARLLTTGAGSPFARLPELWPRIGRRLRRLLGDDIDGLGAWAQAAAVVAAERTSMARPDLVLSIAYPISALVAGERISRALGVPHVADLGDPWSARGPLGRLRRRKTLRSASALITANQALAAELRPHLRRGASVLVAPAGGELPERPDRGRRERPLFIHLGMITPDRIDPRPAFEALRALDLAGEIELRSHSREWLPGRDEPLYPHLPPIPHGQSLELVARADCLVLLGNRRPSQVPSKAYEIACTSTWALCVSELPDDPTLALLRESGHAIGAANDRGSIQRGVREVIGRVTGGRRPSPSPEHSWERRVEAVAELVERVARTSVDHRSR